MSFKSTLLAVFTLGWLLVAIHSGQTLMGVLCYLASVINAASFFSNIKQEAVRS